MFVQLVGDEYTATLLDMGLAVFREPGTGAQDPASSSKGTLPLLVRAHCHLAPSTLCTSESFKPERGCLFHLTQVQCVWGHVVCAWTCEADLNPLYFLRSAPFVVLFNPQGLPLLFYHRPYQSV